MKGRVWRWAASVAFVAALLSSGCAAKHLEFKPEIGSSYRMTSTQDQQISTSVMGMSTQVHQLTVTDVDLDVVDRQSNGDVDVRLTFRRLTQQQDAGMLSSSFDTASGAEPSNAAERVFRAMIGKSYTVTFHRDGSVAAVSGLTDLVDQALAEMGTGEAVATQFVRTYFNDEAMKQWMVGQWIYFPPGDLDTGSKWERSYEFTTGIPMRVKDRWTMVERKGGRAMVDVASTIEPPASGKPFEMMGMTVMLDNAHGTQTGRVEVDESTGLTRTAKITQDLTANLRMENIPGMPQGMTMPMHVVSVVVIETQPHR